MAKRRPDPVPPPAPIDDAALFRAAIGPVRELVPVPIAPSTPKPRPRPRQREADEADALVQMKSRPFDIGDPALGDAVEYLQAGVPTTLLKKLRRAGFSVQDEIDLHSMTAPVAESALRRFINECRDAEHYCVRIVHGKGIRSGSEGPVLKGLVEHLLRQRADVLAYASAPVSQGGTGAVLALLARRRHDRA